MTTPGRTAGYSYDYEDRVTGIAYPSTATNSFGYNAFDTRVSKSDSAGTATLMRDGVGVTAPVLSDGSSSFTPGSPRDRERPVHSRPLDRLGTFKVETNASQSVSATRQFDAFGNLTSSTGSPAGPFGFAGAWSYQQDPDSGLMLLGHRYYDSSTGRFLTRDPAKDGRNWYGYCANNPLSHVDSEGAFWRDVAIDPLRWLGVNSIWGSYVRDAYNEEKATLDPTDTLGREAIRNKWRAITPEPYKTWLPPRPSGIGGSNATKGNPIWDRIGGGAKRVGKVMVLVAVLSDAYDLATSDNKVRTGARIAGTWAGAWAGGEAGAAIGTLTGPAAPVCVPLFGLIGAIWGGIEGGRAGEYYCDQAT